MSDTLPNSVEIDNSVLHQTLHDEVVLLNIANQRYYGLNDIGARMWELLLELGTIEAVAERLEMNYDVDPVTLRTDLTRLVGELLNAGLLKASSRKAVP